MIEANKDYVTFDRVFDEKVKDKSFGSAIVNPIKLFNYQNWFQNSRLC